MNFDFEISKVGCIYSASVSFNIPSVICWYSEIKNSILFNTIPFFSDTYTPVV